MIPMQPLLLTALLLLTTANSGAAINISRLLTQFPEFTAFNTYLSATNLSTDINRRLTITVLAFDDSAAAALAGKPLSVVKDVLSCHVILDYFGVQKLRRLILRQPVATVTTLFQASGRATGLQGFLNVSADEDGGVAFGSAVSGAPLVAKLLGPVAARPYNISVVQVNAAIVPPGVDPNPSPPPPPESPEEAAESPEEAEAESEEAESPEEAEEVAPNPPEESGAP